MNRAEIIMTIIGGLTLVTAWLTYLIKSLYKKGMGNQRMVDMESKICGYEVRKRECDSKFSEHGKQIAVSSEKLNYMSEWVTQLDNKIWAVLSKKKSPRELTKAGVELLNISGGKECIDRNCDFFIHSVEEYSPKLPYDVERRSLDVVLANTNGDHFDDIKNFIYKSPEFIEFEGEEVRVSIFSIGFVMSLYLRDLYLEKYPKLCE